MRKNLLITFSFIFMAIFTIAQEDSDCSKILKKAQRVYDSGEIEKVIDLIEPCLEEGFTNAEKTEAYKLIILVQLFEDNIPDAEFSMVDLLKINPDFKPKFSDHQEIKDLYKKFRTDPLLIIDFTAGINFSEASVLKYHTLNYESPYFKDYYTKLGASFNVVGNYLIKNNFRISAGAGYKTISYGIYEWFGYDGSGYDVDAYQSIDAVINTSQIGLQIGGIKEFGRRKLMPYAGLGIQSDLYLSSNHTIRRSYINNEASVGDVTGEKVESLANVTGLNFSTLLDLGFRYKIGLKGRLIFSIKTTYGLINQTYDANRYANPELVYKYYFLPDDFLMHNLSINIGYSQLIFRPKKLK